MVRVDLRRKTGRKAEPAQRHLFRDYLHQTMEGLFSWDRNIGFCYRYCASGMAARNGEKTDQGMACSPGASAGGAGVLWNRGRPHARSVAGIDTDLDSGPRDDSADAGPVSHSVPSADGDTVVPHARRSSA